MFFNGVIRLTFLGLAAKDGLMGLSRGAGLPDGFMESDFSSYGPSDVLRVSPLEGLESSGYAGGPFSPSNRIYTLTNAGTSNVTWSATHVQSWVNVFPIAGTLIPGVITQVVVTLNAQAGTLNPGSYVDSIVFSNATTGFVQARTVDLTAWGEIVFDSASYTVGEAGGAALITVRRAANTNRTVTVDFATSNGTATAGSDYVATNGTLVFAAGDTLKSFAVPILNDSLTEGNESVNLMLSHPTGGGTLGDPRAATLTIMNDDAIRVSLFFDPLYVDTSTNTSGEASNVKAALEAKGCFVTPFVGVTDTAFSNALADADILYIPELEVGNLAPALSAGAKSAISNYVEAGKGLIINGVGGYDANVINAVFGLAVAAGDSIGTSLLTTNAADTSFAGGPATIAYNNAVCPWLKSSLPTGARSIYEYSTSTMVALLDRGMGKIVFLAYDWFDAVPRGAQDGGWDEVLRRAVLAATTPTDFLTLTPADDLTASGYEGGPFSPSNKVYRLTNTSVSNLTWAAGCSFNWVSVTPSSGVLSARATTDVIVTINANANGLGVGAYNATVTFSNVASGVVQTRTVNLTVRGEIAFDSASYTVDEAGGTALITVRRAGNTNRTVTMDFATSNGTATAGSDYVATNGTLVFAAGDTLKSFAVPILNDSLTEGDESMNLMLSHPTGGGTVGDPCVATLTITDDDGFFDDFDPDIDLPQWLAFGGTVGSTVLPTNYGGFVSSPNSLWFGDASDRFAATRSLNTSVGGPMSFWLRFGSGFTPWEAVDLPTEGVVVEYSADGGTNWTEFGRYDTTNFYSWTYVSMPIPVAAQGSAMRFRWRQLSNSGTGCDHWALDDVLISTMPPDALEVTPEAGWNASGHPGGPFSPSNAVYTLVNAGTSSLSWTACSMTGNATQNWVTVTPSSGTLGGGASAQVTVAINSQAAVLPEGVYGNTVVFSNAITTVAQTRLITLTVFTSPRLTMTPSSLTVTNVLGGRTERVLAVGNAAGADGNLTFQLSTREQGSGSAPFAGLGVGLPPAGHDFTKVASGVEFRKERLLVRFAEGMRGATRAGLLAQLGGATVEREYKIVPGLCLVKLPQGVSVAQALASFNGTAGVVYAEPDYQVKALGIPNDARFSELWGMHNTGQTGGRADADMDAPEAWDAQTGSRETVVAVIDTGVDYNHEDLSANMWRNPGEISGNGIDDDGNGYVDDVYGINAITLTGNPMDDHDHGTHCAGTIGGVGNNGVGVAGVCWQVRIMALKFLDADGGGYAADAITCIEYAIEKGARVLSNSWGGGGYEQALKDAIDAAGAVGITFVAAAGNSGMDTDVSLNYPSCYTSANVIAVMATDDNDTRAYFSNYGRQTVDLGAPGVDILSCKRSGGYQTMSGTSMATPHVAGACGLLLSQNSSLSVTELKNALLRAVDVPTTSLTCVSSGRLNVARAVMAVEARWLTVNPRGATNMPPGSSTNIAVGFNAGDLNAGTYTGEIVVASNDRLNPLTNVPARMVVLRDDLGVTPSESLAATGMRGGPFTPESKVYTLTNGGMGTGTIHWSATSAQSWVTVLPSSGTLVAGEAVAVTVALNNAANVLPAGVWGNVLMFSNQASGAAFRRAISLEIKSSAVADDLQISPDKNLEAMGRIGGPFSPSNKVYRLVNAGLSNLTWVVGSMQSWVTVEPMGGVLGSGMTTNLTVSINDQANLLSGGIYSNTVTLSNLTSGGLGQTRSVYLMIKAPPPEPFGPIPTNDATDVAMDTDLSWNNRALPLFAGSGGRYAVLENSESTYDDFAIAHIQGLPGMTATSLTWSTVAVSSGAELRSLFDLIYFSVSPAQSDYANLRAAVSDGGALEQFTFLGGTLVLNVAGNQESQSDITPGGVDYDRSIPHESETFASPEHPYVTGTGYGGSNLTTSMFLDWYSTDHGSLIGIPAGSTSILLNADGISMVEFRWGAGKVIASTLTFGWDSAGPEHSAQPFDNQLLYAAKSGSDDGVTYEVFFGTNPAVALIASNLTRTTCDPGLLDFNTTYYWKVIASNAVGCTTGPMWSFTTSGDMIQFASNSYSVNESGGLAMINVIRANGSLDGVTVDYGTSNGTAAAGSDYVTATGSLVFAAGQLTNRFAVSILNNGAVEADKTVNLLLRNPSSGTMLGSRSTSVLRIVNDDIPPRQEFRILSLLASGSQVVDHEALTGDDRGGIAASTSRVLYSGDGSTARFMLNDLSGGTALGQVFDALVSDLRSGEVYSLANGLIPLTSVGGIVTTLLIHDPATGLATTNTIALSSPISLSAYGNVGIFAGYGCVLLHTGSRVFAILLPGGIVQDLGEMSSPGHTYTENWAYWGVAEYYQGTNYLVYAQNSTTIARTAVPSGTTSPLATFANLSDMACFTVAVPLNRWYFHHEGMSQFGGTWETIGYADASFLVGSMDNLEVMPETEFETSGHPGGPFSPSSTVYTVSNVGTGRIAWTAGSARNWVTVTPSSGILEAGASAEVMVAINSQVTALPEGIYSNTVIFSNVTTTVTQTRKAQLTIKAPPPAPFNPIPTNGAVGVATTTNLTWNNSGFGEYAMKFMGGAINNGAGHYILVSNTPALNADRITVEFWVKRYFSSSDDSRIMGKYSNDLTDGWRFNFQDTNIVFGVSDGYDNFLSGGCIPLNEWTHVAGMYDGTNQELYVNGERVAQRIFTGGRLSSAS